MNSLSHIEGIYPLAPLQKALLFDSLYSLGSGTYGQQSRMTISGRLDAQAMRRAWEKIVERHSSLRTSFVWEQQEHPVQVVKRRVKLPWQELDWRPFAAAEQAKKLQEFLAADRKKGFDFTRAPLLRVTLIRTADHTHELVATTHHIILDGWSNSIVVKELLTFVQPLEEHNQADGLALEPPAYREYIQWIQRQNAVAAEFFWRNFLRGFHEPTLIPDMQPGNIHGDAAAQRSCEVRLESEIKSQLQELAIRSGVTLSTVLAGAWALLLSCCNDRQDVVFGLTVSGRPTSLPGAEDIVGLFINTLPFRAAGAPEMPLSDWLQELQTRTLELQDFCYSDLVEVRRWSDVAPGRPLFESIFVFDNYPKGSPDVQSVGQLSFHNIHSIDSGTFPLAVIAASGEELRIGMTYDSARLDDASASRLLDRYCGILRKLLCSSCPRVWDITALCDHEAAHLVNENNATHCDYGIPACMHELFEQQASASPQAIALSMGEQQWTYRELNERANRLACYLHENGVRTEHRVGIHLESSAQTVLAALAILKAGGAYLPLDAGYPQQVLHHMILDAGVQVIITEEKLSANLPQGVTQIVDLAAEHNAIDAQPSRVCMANVSPDNLAYVIYTSGSTGLPKGVAVSHRNAFNTIRWIIDTFSINSTDRILLGVSPSFDPSVAQVFSALWSGAELICMKAGASGASHILNVIEGKRLTLMDLSPSVLALLVGEGRPEQFKSVKRVLTGGEVVPAGLLPSLFSKLSVPFSNLYGPTETCINASLWTCAANSAVATVPIGRAIANVQLYLLDPCLQPVPAGIPGEIFIGGAGVSRGYLNRPELTGDKFIPDLYGGKPGARLYRTGDLGRYLADGNIEFLGRNDSQVKIRGLRIEMGQVENVIREYPAVREAAVAVRENKDREPLLVAYVVGREPNLERDLKTFLKSRLPGYMVPSLLVFLEQLPRLPNGKINQKQLPALDFESAAKSQKAARNEWEELLVTIWASVLRMDRVGVDDNFFALGGHSLLAIRIASKIQEAFGADVPIRLIFEKPTIAELSEEIQTLAQKTPKAQFPGPASRVPGGRSPMSFSQQRIWFLDRLSPGDPFYNVPEALRLRGRLDVQALEQALAGIVSRHAVLRTTYADDEGQLVQMVSEHSLPHLQFVDLTNLEPDQRQAQARRLAEQEARFPFDLERGPLLRTKLLKLDKEDHLLLMTFHHIAVDGWSLSIIEREISMLYRASCEGVPALLSEQPFQYADFAAWEQERLNRALLDEKLGYWKSQLAGSSGILELPTDLPRPPTQNFRGSSWAFTVPAKTARLVKRLGRQESTTSFMILLAAFNALLYRYSSQKDILVGCPVSGRHHPELANLVGLLVNTIILRTDLSDEPSFRELLRRVRSTTISAYSNQDVPFEKVIEAMNPPRELSRSPLFQVMFSFQQGDREAAPDLGNLQATPFAVEAGTSKFDLELLITESSKGFEGILEYNTDLFLPETIAAMASHFCNFLKQVAEDPDVPVLWASFLDDDERRGLLDHFSAGPQAKLSHCCFHQLFEALAEKAPGSPAVVAEDGSLTYRELNEKSNSIAHALMNAGLAREKVVAVLADRGSTLLCAMLGIWKAGGVYLPLDPRYPSQRLVEILEQSRADTIIVTPAWEEILSTAVAETQTPSNIRVWNTETLFAKPARLNPTGASLPANLAYVIFTSGSTGSPKGALVEHRSMLNHLLAKVDDLNLTREDAVAQTAPQCFDISIWQFLAALLVGGRTHVCSDEVAYDPRRLLEEVEAARLSILEVVPSLLRLILDDARQAPHQFSLPSLRWLIPTGEELPPELVRQWLERYPAIPVMNAYGPTECADDITHCAIYEAPDANAVSVPIGKPVRNMALYVLDAHMELVPRGVPGELFVSGVGVGRGYIHNPEQTALAFLPNPFAGDLNARVYRTGDRVRFLRNGQLDFLGRIDRQTKIRGFRVELGEVEFRLRQHRGVRDCAVVDSDGASGSTQLVAYVAPDRDQNLSAEDLRAFLKLSVPDYMVPSLILFLDTLPLMPSGKVDRQALPKPDLALVTRPRSALPQTEIERRLARIWEGVLQIAPVGVNDNFFDMGGHSILALRLMGEIHTRFGHKLPLTTLFQHGTIKELAKVLETSFSHGSTSAVIAMQPAGSNPPLFFIHVGSGEVICYVDLVRHLGRHQPFYGLQDPNLYSDAVVDMSIEERATQYLEAVKSLQPLGPYFLGGWSFGGLVAFEMARQLHERGERVALLALLDTGSPDFVREMAGADDDAALLGIIARELNLSVKDAELRSLSLHGKFQFLAGLMRDAGLAGGDAVNFLSRQLAIFKSRNRVIRQYVPSPYNGVITFFRAGQEYVEDPSGLPSIAREPARGFAALTTQPVDLHVIPGNHHQIAREPAVQILASVLSGCVQKILNAHEKPALQTQLRVAGASI